MYLKVNEDAYPRHSLSDIVYTLFAKVSHMALLWYSAFDHPDQALHTLAHNTFKTTTSCFLQFNGSGAAQTNQATTNLQIAGSCWRSRVRRKMLCASKSLISMW